MPGNGVPASRCADCSDGCRSSRKKWPFRTNNASLCVESDETSVPHTLRSVKELVLGAPKHRAPSSGQNYRKRPTPRTGRAPTKQRFSASTCRSPRPRWRVSATTTPAHTEEDLELTAWRIKVKDQLICLSVAFDSVARTSSTMAHRLKEAEKLLGQMAAHAVIPPRPSRREVEAAGGHCGVVLFVGC